MTYAIYDHRTHTALCVTLTDEMRLINLLCKLADPGAST